jgi:Flp pilus assembly protein TadG
MGSTMRISNQQRRGGPDRDRGMITLEVLIVFPALFLLLMLLVQVALVYFAKQAALAAAEQGVRVAAASGNPQDGVTAATKFATSTASSILAINGTNGVTSTQDPVAPNQIQITVNGTVTSLVPTFTINLNVSQTAVGTVEKFTSAGNP